MKISEKELLELKDKVEAAKNEVERLRGRKQQLMEQLKKEYKLNSIDEAKKELEKLSNSIKELNITIDASTSTLEEKLKNI